MSYVLKVFIDANIFVTTWTLDVLLTLADREFVEPVWSEKVLNEAGKAIKKVHNTDNGMQYLDAAKQAFQVREFR